MTSRPWTVPGLPWAPLEEILERRGCSTVSAMARALGVERCTVHALRAGRRRIIARNAERMCEALGLHPAMVWGHEWWLAGRNAGCSCRECLDARAAQRRAVA